MKKALFLCFFTVGAFLLSGVQILAENGKSPFVIVHAGERSEYSANFLRQMIEYSSGAKVAVIPESAYKKGSPAIFVGATAAAKAKKLIPASYAPWEHRIDIEKGAVFLTGADSPGRSVARGGFESGTLKAVITFLERFCNCCFFAPASLREYTVKQQKITLPDTFSLLKKPHIEYCMSRSKQLEYDLATNAFYAGSFYSSLGGHSYPQAVPAAKYLKTNPEYFVLRNGKRNPTRFNHLCLSNKEVQELIYKNLLKQADAGFFMVQLGHTDAFQPCHCRSCANLFGIVPRGKPGDSSYDKDPAWKEKIWILHRNLAQRFMKDRPGKRVAIMAYGPTQTPPATFKKFPANTWIELAPFNAETIQLWRGYQVSGFSAYLYIWGTYNPEGYTPNQSFRDLQQECAGYRKHNIRGLYRCGFGELPGLAGPAYYIWGKLLDNPASDIKGLLKQYCAYAFPKAAAEMEKFYAYLDSRLELQLNNLSPEDWSSVSLLTGTDRSWKPFELFKLRYPEKVLAKLEALLQDAEKKDSSSRMKVVRTEFDYLCHTVRAAVAMLAFRKDHSDEKWQKALALLDKREQFIKALPRDAQGNILIHNHYLFGKVPLANVMMGGRLSATLFAPFNWGAVKLKKYNIKLAGRSVKADSPEWQYLVPHHRWVEVEKDLRDTTVKFRVRRDGENVKFIFVLANARKELRKTYYARVFLGTAKDKMQWFPARFKNGSPSWYKLALSNKENGNKGDKYNAVKGSAGKCVSPAPGVKLAPGEISLEVTLPFAVFGKVPKPGEEWLLNVTGGTRGCDLVWEYNMDQTAYRHTTIKQGKLIF